MPPLLKPSTKRAVVEELPGPVAKIRRLANQSHIEVGASAPSKERSIQNWLRSITVETPEPFDSQPTSLLLRATIGSLLKSVVNDPVPLPAPQIHTSGSASSDDGDSQVSDDSSTYTDDFEADNFDMTITPIPQFTTSSELFLDVTGLHVYKKQYLAHNTRTLDKHPALPWLESLQVTATCRTGLGGNSSETHNLGTCSAKLIRREGIRITFYQSVAKLSTELALLAYDLFDRYGRLEGEYRTHEIRKGSAAWSDQLDEGDILVIENSNVAEPSRRRGLGLLLLKAMLQVTKAKIRDGNFVALLWPDSRKDDHLSTALQYLISPIPSSFLSTRPNVLDNVDPNVIPWARAAGFRRVGSSVWFGLVVNQGRYAPVISTAMDVDPPWSSAMVRDLPITKCSMNNSDVYHQDMQRYCAGLGGEDQTWLSTDMDGNNLLHLAAWHGFAVSVRWLSQQVAFHRLKSQRNIAGYTPLEALLAQMEKRRGQAFSGNRFSNAWRFEGHRSEQTVCVALLKGIDPDIPSDDMKRIRFGCTCGDCDNGFISPRMRHTLMTNAESFVEDLEYTLCNSSPSEWMSIYSRELQHFRVHADKYLRHYDIVRRGFIDAVWHVNHLIQRRLQPSEGGVRASIKECNDEQKKSRIKRFFKCGGSVEGIVKMIFQNVVWEDEIYGDGEIVCDETYQILPRCRNDHDFVLVARMWGFETTARWLEAGHYG